MATMKRDLTSIEKEGLLNLLVEHHRDGVSLQRLFNRDDTPSSATYYRWRERFPDEFDGIDRQAQEKAAEERAARMTEFELAQEYRNAMARLSAADSLLQGLPKIGQIIRAEHLEDRWVDDEGNEHVKVKHIYPRDVIQAMKLLQEIARDGIIPESCLRQTQPQARSQLSLPARVDFSKMRVEQADGSGIEVRRLSPADIIDGEAE